MNKKLFSWKALAGLALLVAMGMTSCKNTTEVDPNDPYNTTKPVKPGTSTAGDADLTFTLTNASGGDLTSLWNAWKKNNADAAKELMKKEEVTIALNFANYKLDGKTITVPQFVTTPDGSVINLLVNGFAEAKKAFDLDVATNLKGAEVNITLPATEFDMVLNATGTATTLDGDATLKTLDATASASKKLALAIEDNVAVKGIKMAGALAGVDNVEAIILSADPAIEKGKGFQVGSEKLYVKSAILTANITINGADETALETIYINEGKTLTIANKKAQIEAIVGLGDMSDAAKSNSISFAGDENDFSKIGAISNAHLKARTTNYVDVKDMSIFENVVFDMNVNLLDDGAADTEFNGGVNVIVGEDVDKILFSNVNFGKKAKMYFDGSVDIVTSKTLIKMFQYSKADGVYKAVKDDDEDNVSAANKKGDEAEFAYKPWLYGGWANWAQITAAGITLTDKFHFALIETPQDALNKAYDAYKKAATDGGEGYTSANSKYAAYQTAWGAVYGLTTVKTAGTQTKEVEFNKATDTSNLYVLYEDEWAWVNAANAAIDGSSWFTLYTYDEDTLEPDLVSLEFDADCTIGGKAMDVDKLNTMCVWRSVANIADWMVVSYGDTVYKWAKTTGGAYYIK